jgi:hypothetical protein
VRSGDRIYTVLRSLAITESSSQGMRYKAGSFIFLFLKLGVFSVYLHSCVEREKVMLWNKEGTLYRVKSLKMEKYRLS